MRTRPASIATVVIAIGLALTTAGVARGLPYTFGGVGSRSTIEADLWAHGTAISPALVALACLAILAAIAMRPTRGGRRAATWLAVLAGVVMLAGLAEPAQQDLVLLGSSDAVLTSAVFAFHIGLTSLALSSIGEARRSGDGAGRRLPAARPLVADVADDAPVSVVVPGVPGPAIAPVARGEQPPRRQAIPAPA